MDNFRLSDDDRMMVRWGWLRAQGDRCGVCGTAPRDRQGHGARWVLDYDRDHNGPDGASCLPGGECFDCVLGTTCRVCMLHLRHFRQWGGYEPRGLVNGVSPSEWTVRAAAWVAGDFRVIGALDAGCVGEAGEEADR